MVNLPESTPSHPTYFTLQDSEQLTLSDTKCVTFHPITGILVPGSYPGSLPPPHPCLIVPKLEESSLVASGPLCLCHTILSKCKFPCIVHVRTWCRWENKTSQGHSASTKGKQVLVVCRICTFGPPGPYNTARPVDQQCPGQHSSSSLRPQLLSDP